MPDDRPAAWPPPVAASPPTGQTGQAPPYPPSPGPGGPPPPEPAGEWRQPAAIPAPPDPAGAWPPPTAVPPPPEPAGAWPPPSPSSTPPPGWWPPAGPRPAPTHGAGRLSKLVLVAVVAAGLGCMEISFYTRQTVNGVVTECDYTNLAPIIFGPVALVLGLVAVARSYSRRAAGSTALDLRLGLLALALGTVHVLRGFGVIDLELFGGSPC